MGIIDYFKSVISRLSELRDEERKKETERERSLNRVDPELPSKLSKCLYQLSQNSYSNFKRIDILEGRTKKLKRNLSMVAKELSRTKDALNAAEAHILALENPELTDVHVHPSVWLVCKDNAHLRVQTARIFSFYKEEIKRRWWNKRYNPFIKEERS